MIFILSISRRIAQGGNVTVLVIVYVFMPVIFLREFWMPQVPSPNRGEGYEAPGRLQALPRTSNSNPTSWVRFSTSPPCIRRSRRLADSMPILRLAMAMVVRPGVSCPAMS